MILTGWHEPSEPGVVSVLLEGGHHGTTCTLYHDDCSGTRTGFSVAVYFTCSGPGEAHQKGRALPGPLPAPAPFEASVGGIT
jgi:hypothetical protein